MLEFAVWFTRRGLQEVKILPDNDEAGRTFAQRVCRDLTVAGVSCRIDNPWAEGGFPTGYDIADFLKELIHG